MKFNKLSITMTYMYFNPYKNLLKISNQIQITHSNSTCFNLLFPPTPADCFDSDPFDVSLWLVTPQISVSVSLCIKGDESNNCLTVDGDEFTYTCWAWCKCSLWLPLESVPLSFSKFMITHYDNSASGSNWTPQNFYFSLPFKSKVKFHGLYCPHLS